MPGDGVRFRADLCFKITVASLPPKSDSFLDLIPTVDKDKSDGQSPNLNSAKNNNELENTILQSILEVANRPKPKPKPETSEEEPEKPKNGNCAFLTKRCNRLGRIVVQ